MRVVFMGSPEFALPSLEILSDRYSIEAVICQPDRPAGRGRDLTAPATKRFAMDASIHVMQPDRVRDDESVAQIAALRPDLIVVAAYGQILSQELLDLPKHGAVNIHASLLPRWRGAAPIQAAILHADEETGVTIMLMDAGLDTGPILTQRTTKIEPSETGGSLSKRLSQLGAELLIDTLPDYVSGQISPQPQDETLATLAPMLKKSDGALDLQSPAEQLSRQIRAFDPWPGTFVMWDERRLGVKQAHATSRNGAASGEVVQIDSSPAIATTDGLLVLDIVQLSGKRVMTGEEFVRGAPDFIGARLAI